MRILVATDNYPPRYDGISRVLKEILPALHAEHELRVLAPDFGTSEDPWPVTKIKVVRWRVGDYHPPGLHALKILREVKRSDLVFCQTLGSIGVLALLWAKLLGKKTLLYTHSIEWELVPRAMGGMVLRRFLPGLIKRIDRWLYNSVDLLIVPSSSVSETLYYNKIHNKRVVIHLGVDPHQFAPPKDKRKAKQALGIDPECFVVGYHGRLAREKDLRTLLRGYRRFAKRHPEQKTRLLVVGDGLREIRNMLQREDVTITGFVEDPAPFLQAMDAYVMPSLTETSCLSVVEAMAAGLAVVSTPVGYVKDYIADGKSGLFFAQQDSVLLSRHLTSLLDPKLRKRFGNNARRSIQQRFNWDVTREQVLSVIARF